MKKKSWVQAQNQQSNACPYLLKLLAFFIIGILLWYYFILYQQNQVGPIVNSELDTKSRITVQQNQIAPIVDSNKFDTKSRITTQVIAQSVDPVSDMSLEFGKLDNIEEVFESTLRSCIGSRCFNQLVKIGTDYVYRVGLVALPHTGAELLMDLLNELNSKNNGKVKFEIIYSLNVPAYGYGKNHGWSSIIRISRRLIHNAYAIVKKNNLLTTNNMDIFESQVSQLSIFHCRNSHVAAHTRMLTVFMDQLYSRSLFELENIITYIGLEYDRKWLVSISSDFRDKLAKNLYETSIPWNYYQAGLKTLKSELELTDTMSMWPCRSFRKDVKLSSLLPIKPHEIAANCSLSFVTCSVGFDRKGG